jgi:hypothetical protein
MGCFHHDSANVNFDRMMKISSLLASRASSVRNYLFIYLKTEKNLFKYVYIYTSEAIPSFHWSAQGSVHSTGFFDLQSNCTAAEPATSCISCCCCARRIRVGNIHQKNHIRHRHMHLLRRSQRRWEEGRGMGEG